jgi:hypothetical protein
MIKKFILVFTLFLIFSNNKTFADWEKFGETDSATYYINFNETSYDDKYIYYWILTDYFKAQENSILTEKYFSKKVYKQTDCKRFRTSAMQIILYENEMSEGNILINESYKESSFTTPIFESIGFEELEQICSHTER